jgi:hypothetical protein
MKIGARVQAILRFYLRNLRSCNVDITEEEGFMNYTVEMGSGAMIYIRSFIDTVFRHSRVNRGDTHTDTGMKVISRACFNF